jgi:hypothetical protein
MKIITISGQAQHGKTSVAKYIKKYMESKGKSVLIFNYADTLKFFAKEYFGWDGAKDDKGRSILQKIGTDIGRERNPNIWVNIALEFIKTFGQDFDYIVIADCRFENEISLLKQSGYKVFSIWIFRPDFDNGLTQEQKNHPSETSLLDFSFDAVLSCPTGLDKLEYKIYSFLDGNKNI